MQKLLTVSQVVLFSFCLSAAAFPETLISFAASGPASDSELGLILERAVCLELGRGGLSVVRIPQGDKTEVTSTGNRYLATCSMSADEGMVHLSMDIDDLVAGRLLASARVDGPLDLSLDASVANLVRAVLARSGLDRLTQRVAPTSGTEPAALPIVVELARKLPPSAATVSAAELASALPELPAAQPAEPALTDASAPDPEFRSPAGPAPAQASILALPATSRRLSFQVRAAPLLIVGGASELFQYGADLSFSLLAERGFGWIVLGGALRADVARVFPVDSPGQGFVYLSSLGFDGRLTLPAEGDFRFSLRGGGGPCLVLASPDTSSALVKVLPQASAALGLRLGRPEAFVLDLDVGFYALFERVAPLLAVTPGISAGWHL